jgi:hypothetical protein
MNGKRSYRLEEISGHQFASLTGAQKAASSILADVLTDTVRGMLQEGILIVENGLIVPNCNYRR